MRETIFLVEADVSTSQPVQLSLEAMGFEVRIFSAAAVMEAALRNQPSLLLLAATLPEGSGVELCSRIRQNAWLAKIPIVILTSDASQEGRFACLHAGADDCIVKPLSPRELAVRIQTILHREEKPFPTGNCEPSDITIDRAAMKLSVRGSEVVTTTLEFRLVDYLARHRGKVFTRDVLLDAVWGEMQFVSPRSVDACIRRVRGKIEPDRTRPTYLTTVRGVGYRFDAVATWPIWTEQCTCYACVQSRGSSRPTLPGEIKRKRKVASQR